VEEKPPQQKPIGIALFIAQQIDYSFWMLTGKRSPLEPFRDTKTGRSGVYMPGFATPLKMLRHFYEE